MSNDRTTNHAHITTAGSGGLDRYQCPDRTWCAQSAAGGEHDDFHASEIVRLDGHQVDEHGAETGWWCWLTEDRLNAHLVVPRPGQRLVLEGRPNTGGGPAGVVDVELDLGAASYLLAALDSEGARDALWGLVDAAAGREPRSEGSR